MYSHLLLAADGSSNATRAAIAAANLISAMPECRVEVLYVIDPAKVKDEVLHAQNHEEIEYNRRQKLMPVQEELKKRHITYHITMINGEPGSAIVEYADQHEVDLIVIGSRGLNTLREFVLGSVSHNVVKRAHCPVMIIK